jgi:hypothetical protein
MNTETVWMSVILLCILLVKCLTEIGKHNLNLP